MTQALELFFQISPPTVAGTDDDHKVLSTATSGAAVNYDWITALGANAPKGSCMLLIEATTQDLWVRFKPTNAAAGTTTTNGLIVKAGQPGRPFWVDPIRHRFIDVIAAGVGSMQVQVASPIGYRRDI